MVAPASGWICPCERDRDEWLVVSDLPQLAGKSNRAETRRCEALSTSRAVLFRVDLGRLYTWLRLEPHRVGAANADLYCVALM